MTTTTIPNGTPNATASLNATEMRSVETDRRAAPRRWKPPSRSRTFTICPSFLRSSGWSLRWSIPKRQRFLDFFFDSLSTLLEWFVYGIGPLLIVLALAIMLELAYTFFYILLPMIHHKYLHSPFRSIILLVHCTLVTCILINVLFNYVCCVLQKHTGTEYEKVIQEYAALADVTLPLTPQELATYRRDLIERLSQRLKQAESDAEATSGQRPKQRAWMLLGPHEWGYCSNSQQIKPPRAHYEHVTKSLVLNLDHYCPWMFNAIGYFNYRYFVNFLLFTMLGMIYGAFLLLEPFLLSKSSSYHEQVVLEHQYHMKKRVASAAAATASQFLTRIRPMVPFRSEKLYITLSFMLCVAVGIALLGLGGFHFYLVSTGQTTIEFHARWRRKGSPYSRGTRLANWQQVYGISPCAAQWWGDASPVARWMNVLVCILVPRYELPQYLPVPIPGQDTRRRGTVAESVATPQECLPLPIVEAV